MIEMIANELKLHSWQVEHTLSLLEEGNTVPFIARYRKEMTGGLDEEQIRKIEELKENTLRLEKRREDVLRLLKEQGVLDEGLNKAILACEKISQIDDLYRPYQQKKKTRAMLAKEAGLEPLAEWIRKFYRDADIQKEAQKYVKGAISSIDEAIQGAKDILAQWIAEDVEIRAKVKDNIVNFGRLETKKKKDAEDEKKVYQMYYEFSERVNRLAPHRIMAIDRGEKENIISVSFSYNKEYLSGWVARYLMRNRKSPLEALVQEAIEDGLKRLVYTAIEREVRRDLSAVAQEKSIQVFSMNLEHLLLQPPLKNKVILGFDPAYRTGCKLAVIDTTGKLLKVDVIYPHVPHKKVKEASEKLLSLIENYHVEVIAIGNGTASRESESFVADFVHKHDLNVSYTIVSEAGASVYSASKAAKEEFADLPVEHRSAVSIARRLHHRGRLRVRRQAPGGVRRGRVPRVLRGREGARGGGGRVERVLHRAQRRRAARRRDRARGAGRGRARVHLQRDRLDGPDRARERHHPERGAVRRGAPFHGGLRAEPGRQGRGERRGVPVAERRHAHDHGARATLSHPHHRVRADELHPRRQLPVAPRRRHRHRRCQRLHGAPLPLRPRLRHQGRR